MREPVDRCAALRANPVLGFLETLIWLFFGVLAALIVFFAFTPVANIVAAPFNALMAEKIEMHLTGKAPTSGVSFTVDKSGNTVRLRCTVGTDNWAVHVVRTLIG